MKIKIKVRVKPILFKQTQAISANSMLKPTVSNKTFFPIIHQIFFSLLERKIFKI